MTACRDPIIEKLFVQASVRELLPKPALSIASNCSIADALSVLADRRIGSVVVADTHELRGIFTERDLLCRTLEKDFRSTSIESVMTRSPRTVPKKISVARIVYEMATVGCRHLILQGEKEFEVVSSTDVVEYLSRVETMKTALLDGPLCNLLDSPIGDSSKGALLTVSGTDSVQAAWRLMAKQRKGCVVVVGEGGTALGVFSERDLVRGVLAHGKDPSRLSIEENMTRRPRTLPQVSSWGLALGLMAEKNFRHIPVVDDNERAIGMVSVRDCFDRLAATILRSIS